MSTLRDFTIAGYQVLKLINIWNLVAHEIILYCAGNGF